MGKGKKKLTDVTLLGIDCLDINRLIDVARICCKQIEFGDVKLLSSQPAKLKNVVPIPHLGTIEACSHFIVKELYKHIDTEFFLMIQYDGFILNPNAWDDNFLKYDYIGAPWAKGQRTVGNGGFSLRSKRLHQLLATDNSITETYPEDGVICKIYGEYLESKGIKFAPESLAKKFSFEANYKFGLAWDRQFGFHSYCGDLTKWNPLSYANLFFDRNFLLTFIKQQYDRKRRKIDRRITEIIVGDYYSLTQPSNTIRIKSSGSKLRISSAELDDIFFPFDEQFYFSDEANSLIKFYKNDAKYSIMMSIIFFPSLRLERYEKKVSKEIYAEIQSLYIKSYQMKKHSFGSFEYQYEQL
jgi:hypothetical protein